MKPVVDSWDVFDTLVARFVPEPRAVLETVAAEFPHCDFLPRRLAAQAALDRVGAPYTVHAIYRQMVLDGVAQDVARAMLRAEIAAERASMIPIRRNVDRVQPDDLIVSDMYLPAEIIAGFLFETCRLHRQHPIVVSNWGKASGTLWPVLLTQYAIRLHHGDNPRADGEIPGKFHIPTEITRDHLVTAWEHKVVELGLPSLAYILREVRLRCIPPQAGVFHAAVVGPYLALLVGWACYLAALLPADTHFAFLSRDCDELARIFVTLFADRPASTLDLSRRLIRGGGLDSFFASRIDATTVLVDVVSSGRSVDNFLRRSGAVTRRLHLLLLLETLLTAEQKRDVARRVSEQRLHSFGRLDAPRLGHYPLECLLQAHYPPVLAVAHDPASGGVVRRHGAPGLTPAEADLLHWKSEAVSTLTRTLRARPFDPPTVPVAAALLQAALDEVLRQRDIVALFPSFIARERFDPH